MFSWVSLPRQKEKDKFHHLYVTSKNIYTNKLIYKTETDSHRENKLTVTKEKKGRDKLGVWG